MTTNEKLFTFSVSPFLFIKEKHRFIIKRLVENMKISNFRELQENYRKHLNWLFKEIYSQKKSLERAPMQGRRPR